VKRRIFAMRCGVAGGGCVAAGVRHDVRSPLLPRGADSEGGRLNSNQIFLFECPRFMSLSGGQGRGGFGQDDMRSQGRHRCDMPRFYLQAIQKKGPELWLLMSVPPQAPRQRSERSEEP
jgi:hypothetical protein